MRKRRRTDEGNHAPGDGAYGRNSKFSSTTSTPLCCAFTDLPYMYKFMWTLSPPGEGTPEVKTCSAATAGGPGFSRAVMNSARPGSHRKECVTTPSGELNRQ